MTTIAIIGAAGRVGREASKAFVAAGWTVRGLGRGAKVEAMAPGVEPVACDAFDRAALIAACKGADVILHAANPPYDKWATTVLPLMENTLHAAREAGATVLLPGNVYNYGLEIGMDMTETSPWHGSTEKARIRIAMEELCRDFAGKHGTQVLVLRAGDFFGGEGEGTWLDLMILKDLASGRFNWPGRPDIAHAFAYLPDLAKGFVTLAEHRGSLPVFDHFNFCGHTVSGAEMKAAAEAATGRKLALKQVNWTMLKLAGLFMPVVRAVVKMRYLWDAPHSLDGSRYEATFGAPEITPLTRAMAGSIAALHLGGAGSQKEARRQAA